MWNEEKQQQHERVVLRAKGENLEDIHRILSLSLQLQDRRERERKEGLSDFHEQRERGCTRDDWELFYRGEGGVLLPPLPIISLSHALHVSLYFSTKLLSLHHFSVLTAAGELLSFLNFYQIQCIKIAQNHLIYNSVFKEIF